MKKWLLTSAALLFLAGCQDETAQTTEKQGPAGEIETKIEEAFGTEIAIPTLQNHEIGLAYLDGEGDEQTAHLIYQTTTKPMEGMTAESWAESNKVELLHGELYKDAPLAELDIFQETYGSMDEPETREIAGEKVDYALIPGPTRDTAYIGFDKEGAGYLIKYQLAENQKEEEAINFAKQIIEGLN